MTDDSLDDAHEGIFEKRLASLKLARPSDTYLEKGIELIHAGQPVSGFWQRYLPVVLASALVVSVSANVFQLLNNRQQSGTTDREPLAQCNTPAAAATPAPSPAIEFATYANNPEPTGMC